MPKYTHKKEYALFAMYDPTTGEEDTGAHTIYYQPDDQTYPTGRIQLDQIANTNKWIPQSDLDAQLCYDVIVDGVEVEVFRCRKARPSTSL